MHKFNVNIQMASWNVIIPNIEAKDESEALSRAVKSIKEDPKLARRLPKHPEKWAKITKVFNKGCR